MGTRKRGREGGLGRKFLSGALQFLCAIIVIVVFLSTVQCTIKKPEAPSWRTNLVIPLANKTWDMPELVDKLNQDNLTTDSLGNPIFYYEQVLDTVTISGSFAIGTISRAVSESLGTVSLDPPATSQISASLADYVSLQSGNVPPVAFDINETLPPLTGFSEATVAHGNEIVIVENDFGLYLDTVTVTLADIGLGNIISTYTIPGGLNPGQVAVDTIDISGYTISNQFGLYLHCHTPGATTFSLAGRTMTAGAGMPDGLEVSSATAEIPRLTREFEEAIPFESEHLIQTALVADGRLVLDLQNNTELAADLILTLPDFVIDGVPLIINQTVEAGESRPFVYDLTGHTLQPSDQVMPQSIGIEVAAAFGPTAPQQATVAAGDRISVAATVDDLSFSAIAGIPGQVTAEFEAIECAIEIPAGFEGVSFHSGTVTISVENGINLPGAFSVLVNGDGGQQKTITGNIASGTPEEPVTSHTADTQAAVFLNPIPEVITVSGSATFGGGPEIGSIHPSDYLVTSILLCSPLTVSIDSATFDGEWEDSDLDIDTAVIENLSFARFHTTIVNRLPVGVSIEVFLSGDSAALYTNPQLRLGPIEVAPGTVGPDGSVITSRTSESVIELDSAQLTILENDTLWMGELITLFTPDGQAVTLTAGDSLGISGWLEIDFNVNDNLWED